MSLGRLDYFERDLVQARTRYEESLEIRRELGNQLGIVDGLRSFASLAFQDERAERAARLWGAVEVLREEVGPPQSPNDRESQERKVAEVREALSAEVSRRNSTTLVLAAGRPSHVATGHSFQAMRPLLRSRSARG